MVACPDQQSLGRNSGASVSTLGCPVSEATTSVNQTETKAESVTCGSARDPAAPQAAEGGPQPELWSPEPLRRAHFMNEVGFWPPRGQGRQAQLPGRVAFSFQGPFSEQTTVSVELRMPSPHFRGWGKRLPLMGSLRGQMPPCLLILDPGSCRANSVARSGP